MGLGRIDKYSKRTLAVVIVAILIILSSLVFTSLDLLFQDQSSETGLYKDSVKPYGPVFPRFNRAPVLYVVNVTNLNHEEILLLTSLQGLVNRNRAELYLEYGNPKWLNFLNQTYDQAYEYISFYDALNKFKSYVAGILVYNPEATATINVATTIVGTNDLIIASPDLVNKISNSTGLNIKMDLREGHWASFGNSSSIYLEVLDTLYPLMKQDVFGMLEPSKIYLRDYLIALGVMCVDINPGPVITPEEDGMINSILKNTPPQTTVLGWFESPTGLEENLGTQKLSRSGKVLLPADHMPNLSVFAAYDFRNSPKKPVNNLKLLPELEDKIYLTFVISDGDNLGFMHNQYSEIWSNANKNDFPLGWSISPLAAELAPPIFEFYSSTASVNDTLVCAPSGAGLFYPDYFPKEHLGPLLARTNQLMEATDLETIWLLNSYTSYEVKYTEQSIDAYIDYLEPTGIFLDYGDVPLTSEYKIGEGLAHSGTPIIRATHMWEDIDNFIAKVEVAKDSKNQGPFFIFAAVHVWTLGPEVVREVLTRLGINDPQSDYRVVSPNDFCRLIQISEVEKAKNNIDSIDEWPYNLGQADRATIINEVEQAEKKLDSGNLDSAAHHAAIANSMINDIKVDIITFIFSISIISLLIAVLLILFFTRKRKLMGELKYKKKKDGLFSDFIFDLQLKKYNNYLELFTIFFVSSISFIAIYRVFYSHFWDWPAIGISIFIGLVFVRLTNRYFYSGSKLKNRFLIGIVFSFVSCLGILVSTYFLIGAILGLMIIIESTPIIRRNGIIALIGPMIFGMVFAYALMNRPETIFVIGLGVICFGSTIYYYNDFNEIPVDTRSLKLKKTNNGGNIRKSKSNQRIEFDAPTPPTFFLVLALMVIYTPFSRYLAIKLSGLGGLLNNLVYIIPISAFIIALPVANRLWSRISNQCSKKYPPGFLERAFLVLTTAISFGLIFFIWDPLVIAYAILIGEICITLLAFITIPKKWLSSFPPYLARDFVVFFLIINFLFITPVISYTLYVIHLGEMLNYVLYAFPISFMIILLIMIIPVAFYWRRQ